MIRQVISQPWKPNVGWTGGAVSAFLFGAQSTEDDVRLVTTTAQARRQRGQPGGEQQRVMHLATGERDAVKRALQVKNIYEAMSSCEFLE